MRALRLSLYFVVGLLLGAYAVISQAGVVNFAASNFLVVSNGSGIPSTITFAPSASGVTASSLAPQAITSGAAPVTVPVTVSQQVAARTIGNLAVGAARRTIPGIVVGAAITGIMNKARVECDFNGCRRVPLPGSIEYQEIPATYDYQLTKPTQYTLPGWSNYYSSPEAVCAVRADVGSHLVAGGPYGKCVTDSGSLIGNVAYNCPGVSENNLCKSATKVYSCPSEGGWVRNGQICFRSPCAEGQIRDEYGQCQIAALTDPQAAAQLDPYVSGDEGVQVVQQAVQAGVPVPAGDPQVSGPASVTSPPVNSTTTINNQTTTTTTTTTVNNTYQGGTYTYNVTNNTVTKNASGEVLSTTKTDVPDEPPAVVTDTPLGDVPKLYERKYPDGLVGVWNTRSAELKATPLFGLTAIFTPNIGAGSCPSWTFNANIGPHMMFGSGSISPPCWIWPAIKAIIIISALLLARRLIFGG